MTVLSEEVGTPVTTSGGVVVGKVLDLTVRLDRDLPTVERVAVGRRRVTHLVPWVCFAGFGDEEARISDVHLSDEWSVTPPDVRLAPHELLLARDVLDAQVIDVRGRHSARVGDVVLAHTEIGTLEVVAVEVGLTPVVRRLGFGAIARRLPMRALPWADLHLRSARGHLVQLAMTTATVHRLDDAGLAHLLATVTASHAVDVIHAVGPERVGAALRHLPSAEAGRLLNHLEPDHTERVLAQLSGADAARFRGAVERPPAGAHRRFRRTAGWRHRPRSPSSATTEATP